MSRTEGGRTSRGGATAKQESVAAIGAELGHGDEWVQRAEDRAEAAARAIHVAKEHAVTTLDRSADAHTASALAHDHAVDAAQPEPDRT